MKTTILILVSIIILSCNKQDDFIIAGAIRNNGSGWNLIKDKNHKPIGIESVTNDSNKIIIKYSFDCNVVNTFTINSDETFIVESIIGGASVGIKEAHIHITKKGISINPDSVISSKGNFWVYGMFTNK